MKDRKAILAEAEAMKDWLVRIRRDLHAIPEPGDEEYKTQEYLCKTLEQLGIPFRKMRTAVVGLVEGAAPGAVVALRADMDACRSRSRMTGLPFPSRWVYARLRARRAHDRGPGAAALLFGAQRRFRGDDKTPVPARGGNHRRAAPMIADGCLENPRVDYVLGLHVMPDLQAA
jgi:metal-dependent amidase/aminoacylase/carboxypeptidase family protein